MSLTVGDIALRLMPMLVHSAISLLMQHGLSLMFYVNFTFVSGLSLMFYVNFTFVSAVKHTCLLLTVSIIFMKVMFRNTHIPGSS